VNIIDEIKNYRPCCEQDERDRAVILAFLAAHDDAFLRGNLVAHMTASAWVVNPARDRVLMVYHKLYDSWAWTGGHADGETDLLSVALRECREETGVAHVRPVSEEIYSLEILPVEGHEKRGQYVPSHLHLNLTYLLEADERAALQVCEAENSGVRWFSLAEALTAPSEPWMVERIYRKLNAKLPAAT
jgi:8-oxo-dGTP pyrophosphatase MutT (NUDIX family)